MRPLFTLRFSFSLLVATAPNVYAQAPDTMVVEPRPGIYSTKEDAAPAARLPWQQQQDLPAGYVPSVPAPGAQQQATPFGSQAVPAPLPPGYQPSVPAPGDIPFQRATPYGSQPVSGPLPMTQAAPVESIESVDVTEPAAPAETKLEANPAEEDPAEPTALTAPLFSADPDTTTPRTIVLRLLNKVTAKAEEMVAKPGETIRFGKLEIHAIQCYRSAPVSLPDSVALLAIREHQPELPRPRLLFHGWMYASSPSLTALEHPIYDVTLVDCRMKNKPADALDAKDGTKEKLKKPAR